MSKFIAVVPARGTKGSYDYNHPKTEEFSNVDAAKTWAGREIMADAKVTSVMLYRLESEFRTKNLIADHIEVLDRR